MKRTAVPLAGIALAAALAASPPAAQERVPVYGYRVVKTYPHDAKAFTQGLIFKDGFLFESTGVRGQSTLRKVRLETGEVIQQARLPAAYFAEGLADWKGRLIQLTWDTNVGFVYDQATFTLQNSFKYSGEGWGLTHDGRRLILSDGTDALRFLDPETFRPRGQVAVRAGGAIVRDLNELEYVRGEVFANVWHTDRIARIAPDTGRVVGWIDLSGLLPKTLRLDPEAVLNGIAFDAATGRLFVTGKYWPSLFEIEMAQKRGE